MIDLSLLPDEGMSWLDASGPKATIVLSTRIRLARNVRGIAFSQRAKDGDRTAVLERVAKAAAASGRIGGAGPLPPVALEPPPPPAARGRAPAGRRPRRSAPHAHPPPGGATSPP